MLKKLNIFLALILTILAFYFLSCKTIKVRDYEIENDKVENEVRIVQLSDFHSNDYGENESILIDKVREASPTLIALTGDFFDTRQGADKCDSNVTTLIDGIIDLCPVYFVSGNHDYTNTNIKEKFEILEEKSVQVLKDEIVKVEVPEGIILVAGVQDPYKTIEKTKDGLIKENKEEYFTRLRSLHEKTLEERSKVEEGGQEVLFSVLLAHRPEYIKEYLKYDYDLILSGHMHGGQWRFPPLINGLYAPDKRLFPRYAGGRYKFKKKKTVMIVSRGLSYQQPNVARIFNPPELVVVRVKKKETSKKR